MQNTDKKLPHTLRVASASGKGGVGKTTMSINVAGCLANLHGMKVLLVDCDPQNSAITAITSLDVDPGFDYGSLPQYLNDDFDISRYDVILTDGAPGLDEQIQKVHSNIVENEDGTLSYVGRIEDIPPSMPPLGTDVIMMPVQPSMLDIDSTYKMDAIYRTLYNAHIHWVWNRVDKSSTLSSLYAGVLSDIKRKRAVTDKQIARLDAGKALVTEGLPANSVVYSRSSFSDVLNWSPHLFFDESDLVNDVNFRSVHADIMTAVGLDPENEKELNRYCYQRAVSFKSGLKDARDMIDNLVHDIFREIGFESYLNTQGAIEFDTLN